jgi:hypothetical protein
MADAGLRVFGDSGVFQIDNTYRNLSLREKGTFVTTSNMYSSVSVAQISARTGFTSPILAVGGSVLSQPIVLYDSGTGRFSFAVRASGPIGTQVPYWIFDVPPPPPASGAGIRVWNASGQLVFDSSLPPLRVVKFSVNSDNPNFSGQAGRSYAVAHVRNGYRQVTIEQQTVRATMTRVNGSTVDGAPVAIQDTDNTPTTLIVPMNSLVIDVTNY